MHYYLHNSDITIELGSNKLDVHYANTESFKVTLVETGLSTKTAGRLKRVQQYTGNEDFLLTYGDGVADINHAVDAIYGAANYLAKHGSIDNGLRAYGGNTIGVLDAARSKGYGN